MKVKPFVEKIDTLNGSDILFKVSNGLGKLKMAYAKDINDNIKVVFYLGDTPLIMCNSEYCPTCSTMIALAEGREEVDENVIRKLVEMNSINNINDGFDKITNILGLLEDGYYILKEIDYYPTDGYGNFFWNLDSKAKDSFASAYYYSSEYGTIITEPKFLLPSQGTNVYNAKRVEEYRSKIQNGEKLYGLAMEVRGALALLLDGHHKASASYIEGKTISCLSIMQVYPYKNYNTNEDGINYASDNVLYSSINRGNEIKEFYYNKANIIDRTLKYEEVFLEEKYYNSIEIKDSKEQFPDYESYALSTITDDTSEERINELLRYDRRYSLDELREVFYNLRVKNKKRARELCFEILNCGDMFKELWADCVRFLSQYKDSEVEDLFINMLVEYDCFTYGYDEMKEIIDKYLTSY